MTYGNEQRAWAYEEYVKKYEQLQSENAQKVCAIQALENIRDSLQAELEKHRWIPVSEEPKTDSYHIAAIGNTGDELGNTLEWLWYNGMWFYARDKKAYPRSLFITHYMPISMPESKPIILPDKDS